MYGMPCALSDPRLLCPLVVPAPMPCRCTKQRGPHDSGEAGTPEALGLLLLFVCYRPPCQLFIYTEPRARTPVKLYPSKLWVFRGFSGYWSPFLVKLGPWDPKVTAGCQPFLSMKKVDRKAGQGKVDSARARKGHALQQWPNGLSLWQDVELTGKAGSLWAKALGQETIFPPSDAAGLIFSSYCWYVPSWQTDTSLRPKTCIPPP